VKDSVTTSPPWLARPVAAGPVVAGTAVAGPVAAGMVTVTRVLAGKPVSGVNSAVLPSTSQVPGMAGEILGSGAPAGSGPL
jgi:hypothetical protein